MFISIFVFTLHANGQELKVTRISEGVYVHTSFKELETGLFPSNGLVIETSESVILIDTPWDIPQTKQLLKWIKENTGKPASHCVVTHSHDDRVSGIPLLAEGNTTIIAYRETAEKLAQLGYPKPKEFDGELELKTGSVRLNLFYPGEGHTSDNIVVWLPEQRILFGGCFVKSTDSKGLGNIADANLKAWPESIRNVQKKFSEPLIIVPGHQGWQSNQSLEHTLKLLKANEEKTN
jgi:metallo-beta-lactamase class B